MNWTSTHAPIEGVKYIVETEGCVFPAHIVGGTWWNTERGFPIEGVKRWIVYPEGEEPNDLIAPEMLLKYLCRDYNDLKCIAKGESEKVKQLRKLNKELTEEFNKLHRKYLDLQANVQNRCSATDEEVEALRQENRKLNALLECLTQVFDAIRNKDRKDEDKKEEESSHR